MDRTLNIGLIGYKFMGKAHSNAFQRIGMFFDPSCHIGMKVICGRDKEWLSTIAPKYGWEEYDTSWENVVGRKDIDVIDITTPSNFHKEIAMEAAAVGKHIFCEKPLALNLKDARQMLGAVRKAGVKHQIGFNYRFAPAVQLMKKLIDQGKIGKIYHFRANYLQDWIMDPEFPLVWRLDQKIAGSGTLGDIGAHLIDMARYLAGEFDRVIGVNRTFIKERPLVDKMSGWSATAGKDAARGKVTVDDATIFLAEFKNGAIGCFETTRFSHGHKNDMSFEINGSKGSLKFEFEKMNELQYFNSEDEEGTQGFRTIKVTEPVHPYMEAWWPAGHLIGYEHTFVHELYEFTEAIANDRQPVPDFSDGVKCSQVLEAVDLSIDEKRWVNIDEL